MKRAWSPIEGSVGINLVRFGAKMIIAFLLLWAAGPQIAQEIAARASVGWQLQGAFEMRARAPTMKSRYQSGK